jgi:hypothetical protein
MATRSCIGIKHGDVIKGIYAHWDGYIDCNGRILNEHYQDSIKVNKLISMGDVSSLGSEIGEVHEFNQPRDDNDWCTFYGRDRGEEGVEFRTFQTESEFVNHFDGMGAEYYYIYDGGVWYVKSYSSDFQPLHEAIEELELEES